MMCRLKRPLLLLLGLLAGGAALGCSGKKPAAGSSAKSSARETAAAANQQVANGDASTAARAAPSEAGDGELDRALDLARESLVRLNAIRDYQCVFLRQERVGGELLDETRMEMKVRQKPFSVYMRFLEPPASAGQEVIYVEGRNDGKLVAHAATGLAQAVGTVQLDPNGMIAMRGGRYPITDAGMTKLVEKLLALGARKRLFRQSRTRLEEIEFAERPCLRVEIRNPAPQGDFRLAIARIVLDKQWDVPVHFEAWEWPSEAGADPILVESYSYLDLRFDLGLTDLDFDPDNPAYGFP